MAEAVKLDAGISEALKDKLLAVVERGVGLANRNVGYVRNLAVLGLLSSAWLGFYLQQLLSSPWSVTLPLLFVLLLPVLFLGKLFFTLRDIQELPVRLEQCFRGFKSSFEDYHQQFKARIQDARHKRRLSELISLGKDFREVLRLVRNTDELSTAIGGAVVLGNPVFLIVMLIASGATALLILLAVVTLLLFVF